MNKKGQKPARLVDNSFDISKEHSFENTAGKESLTRFEEKKGKSNQGRQRNKRKKKKNERRRKK
jgi:hypothetical protein